MGNQIFNTVYFIIIIIIIILYQFNLSLIIYFLNRRRILRGN
jgi:hypothetical protein